MRAVVALSLFLFYDQLFAQTGTMTDSRDGKVYKTVQIGSKVWMAQNSAYSPSNAQSECYKDSVSACEKYGRLYLWEVAKDVCPMGWRLPRVDEIESLVKILGGVKNAFIELQVAGSSGFDALLSGYYFYGEPAFSHPTGYRTIDGTASFWTSTDREHYVGVRLIRQKDPVKSMAFSLGFSKKKKRAGIGYVNKKSVMSVRCIKD